MFENKRIDGGPARLEKPLKGDVIASTRLIAGESFDVEQDDGDIVISHRLWSLAGRGKSLASAEADLFKEASELAEVFLPIPVEKLDWNASRLREFLLKIAG